MPQELLTLPPVYCVVGIYRLLTDPLIRQPVWDKCRHGVRRGGLVGLFWAALTWKLQKAFVGYFLLSTPRFTGLSNDRVFGYQLPLDVGTYATLLFLGDQITGIINFFLSRNLGIARDRAWDQTMTSRGKEESFWGGYVEVEWEKPPHVTTDPPKWEKHVGNKVLRIVISKSFGFTAALLESIPIIGIGFTISNRIASYLEKRQDLFRRGEIKPLPPRIVTLDNGEKLELAPSRHAGAGFTKEEVTGGRN
ncbi:hypothetical protein RHS04_08196 [Rhizoctonia solani]|uniref:Uncharacterized protein n=1 Tax=Rhizoctonia solani TaxID=456999 RepID=A0A8H7I5L5_9AGAM